MASNDLTPLFVKGIAEHFYVDADLVSPKYTQIFRVRDTATRIVQVQQWQRPGAPQYRNPGEPVAQASFLPSYSKQYTVVNYALGDTIFKEDILDDLYGIIHRILPQRGGALADSFAILKERLAAAFFATYGFASGTSVPGMIDGVSLFNTAHPTSQALKGIASYSNRPSVDIDLSVAAGQAALANLSQQPDTNNYGYLDNDLDVCVVNPNMRQIAEQVFNQQLEPRTDATNKNSLSGRASILYWPYFRSSGTAGATYSPAAWNSWFIVGKRHRLEWWQRSDLAIESDYVINVLSQVYVAYERFTYGAADARGVYGSLGQ